MKKKDNWKKIYEVCSVNINTKRIVSIIIEANFRMKANLSESETKKLEDAIDIVENIVIELRRKKLVK